MKIEKMKIDELISPEYNPRHITPDAMESLKTSLKEFGYIDYIIVNEVNNHVIGGNQRLEALKQLGYTELDVILIHEPDINREKAINIRLNNNSGNWDIGKLDTIFQDLELEGFDLSLTGFQTENLKPVNTEITNNEPITSEINPKKESTIENNTSSKENPKIKTDNNETITCPRCGHEIQKH